MADTKEQAAAEVAEAKAKVVEAVEKRMGGRPTPTQAELDRAILGEAVEHKEDDGSGPDPRAPAWHKAMEGDKPAGQGGSYATRQSRAGSTHTPQPHSTTHG